MQDLVKTLRQQLAKRHYAQNADPKHPTLKQSELEYIIDRDLEIVLAYLKVHGNLAHLMEMRLWYALSDIRKPYDFSLKSEDIEWLDTTINNMTEEQVEDWTFPKPPSARLDYLLACLKDSNSIIGQDRFDDAFDYLMNHSRAFRETNERLYPSN